MKIKKGKLNYDQSGRAYPPNPRVKENWDCIWEYEGKYYKLVGDNEHKEWDEVNIYNQIIDEAYDNYKKDQNGIIGSDWTYRLSNSSGHDLFRLYTKEEFVEKCKKDPKFWSEWPLSETWGLKIEEQELSLEERLELWYQKNKSETGKRGIWEIDYIEKYEGHKKLNSYNIPTKLITLTYNNEKIESHE